MLDSLRQAPIAVYLFVLIGILAAVGIVVNTEFRDGTTSTDGFTIAAETVAIAAAGVDLASPSLTNLTGITIVNATEGADALLNLSSIVINNTGTLGGESSVTFTIYLNLPFNPEWEGVNVNLSYTGSEYNQAGNVIRNSTQGIANITKQLPTVGTVVGVLLIVSAVVGLVGIFSYFRKPEGGVY